MAAKGPKQSPAEVSFFEEENRVWASANSEIGVSELSSRLNHCFRRNYDREVVAAISGATLMI
jgi:hypothetical protein